MDFSFACWRQIIDTLRGGWCVSRSAPAIAMSLVMITVAGCGQSKPTAKPAEQGSTQTTAQDPIASAKQAIRRGNLQSASELLHRLLVAEPDNAVALELSGDLAANAGDSKQAVEYLQLAVNSTDRPSRKLLDKLGQQWMNIGRPFESVRTLNSALARFPDDVDFRQKQVGLLSSLGMQLEIREHLQWLLQRGHGNPGLLMMSADITRPQTIESTCKYALKNYPDDLRPQYSLAQLSAYESDWDEVARLLKPVIEKQPDFLPAQALYGRAIVSQGDDAEINRWAKQLPSQIEDRPQYWLAAGIRAEDNKDFQQAAGAYWRAVRLNENDGEALTRLAAALNRLGRDQQAKSASQRAAAIADVRSQLESLMTWRQNSQTSAVKIARSLDQLGRPWEATSWLQAAFHMTDNKDPNLESVYKAMRGKLTGTTPWQDPARLVATNIDLSELPIADWRHQGRNAPSESLTKPSGADIRFADEASQRNLNHICKLGKPPGKEADLAIYQSGAGGAGVIDFDMDGWADVYLTVMDGSPNQTDSGPNRLFRNLDGQFADATANAGVGEKGFAQGVAIGDYNADGLQDLLVANVGNNRLFRNNGDGTFADVTDEVGLQGRHWTTSAAIADINGDGHAEIFEVGYCAGDKPYLQRCIEQELGEPRSCSPLAFDAQGDRVWQGVGDGTLVDTTAEWLGEHEAGRGFSIIVGDLDGSIGVDVYIANDMTANHYWSPMDIDGKFQFSEQATVRGLALNERSRAQASMGIAAGDADADGDIDFLLTHFVDDHNTFYEQVSPGNWSDRSHRVGLAAPSMRMLGYGTQWIDADNDGTPELFIANGDIDDFTHKNRMFRQPAQFFDRARDGRWSEIDRESLGNYFAKDRLARAVVTLDANRDQQTDLLVTHLFDPVSLLINQTNDGFNQLRFFVRGTSVHRDAIGTQIRLRAGQQELVGQQLAGDGFQCSIEQCITFGVGNTDKVDDVTIVWPNGQTQQLGSLATGKDYLVVEGSGQAWSLTP